MREIRQHASIVGTLTMLDPYDVNCKCENRKRAIIMVVKLAVQQNVSMSERVAGQPRNERETHFAIFR